MSMAVPPLPPPLPRRYRRGGGGRFFQITIAVRRGSGRFFLEVNAKMHESEQKFSIFKCRTVKLNESYQLETTVLILNTHSRQIHSIFLTTIAARSRYSNFWARRGSVAVGFLFLSPRCGSGALAFFFYRRGAVAVTFQPRWTSLS
jgi:hypothetical protein